MYLRNKRSGFTLIELLVVITIISVLAVAVSVALNPAQRIKDAKNARRTADVDSILTAIHEYVVDNKGDYPAGVTAGMVERQLGSDPTGCTIATGGCAVTNDVCLNITTLTPYLKSIPIDPSGGTTYTAAKTGYSLITDANGIVTIRACGAETTEISSSR